MRSRQALNQLWEDETRMTGNLRFVHRLYCLRAIAQGLSCAQVAGIYDESTRTIERWAQRFDSQGVEGIRDENRPGRCASLNVRQRAAIEAAIGHAPAYSGVRAAKWNGQLLSAYIHTEYDVSLSIRQCQRILTHTAGHTRPGH